MTTDAGSPEDSYSEIRSGWRILLAAMLGTGLGLPPLPFYTIGIFAPTLATEFGWSFASIFGGFMLAPVVLLVGGPFVGQFIDKHGPRKIAALSLFGLGISYMTLALSGGSIIQYYASWVAIVVTGLGATSISFTSAVNTVFVRRRGLALGIVLSGIGLFAFAIKPMAAWLIAIAGWRATIVAIGLLPMLVAAPAILWAFPTEETSGDRPDAKKIDRQVSASELTLREALHTRAFWILVLAFVPIGLANGAPFPNMENILRSLRFDQTDIPTLASLIGVTMVSGRLIGGWLLDRMWAPLLGVIVVTGASLGSWILSQQTVHYNEAMLAISLLGLGAGAEIDLLSYLVARYFGLRSYGAIYGAIFGLFGIGAGIGPSLLGRAYDHMGSYSQSLQICALLLFLASFTLMFLGRYPVHLTRFSTSKQ